MKTALIIAAVVGGYVLVRRKQLGHMPHSLGEFLPFGKPCNCAGAGASVLTGGTSQPSRPVPTGGETPPFMPEGTMRDGDIFGGVSPVYGGANQGACA